MGKDIRLTPHSPSGHTFKEKLFSNQDCNKCVNSISELKVDGANMYITYCIFTMIVAWLSHPLLYSVSVFQKPHLPFPFNNFTYFFTLFSKFFSSFHHCTCSLSVSRQYLALDGIYHPLRAAFPNNSTLRAALTRSRTPRHTGFSPSMTSCSKEHRQGAAPRIHSTNYNSSTEGARFQI